MSKVLLGLQLLIALSALRHEGRRVLAGKPVALTPEQAKAVIACGAARVATEEEVATFTAGALGEVNTDTGAGTDGASGGDEGAAASTSSVAAAPPPAAKTAPTKKPGANKPATKSARNKKA